MFVRAGTTWTEQQKLTASDGATNNYLGWSLSVSGDTVVAGAPFLGVGCPGCTGPGAAYVFVRSGTAWTQQQKLVPPSDTTAGDLFGISVSVSGDTAVVGALYDDTADGVHAGSAYVFVRSGMTWYEQQKLTASDGAAFAEFGWSVSVSADTIVVGTFFGSGRRTCSCARARSGPSNRSSPPSDGPEDSFGYSVSVSGETVVVGAVTDDTPGGIAGGLSICVRAVGHDLDGAAEAHRVGWSRGGPLRNLGVGVRRHPGGRDAWDDTPGGVQAGSAYVFVRSGTTWTEEQQLTASDAAGGDHFGIWVSISGDTVVVGAYDDDTAAGVDAGSAYVYVRSGTTWTQQQKLMASDAAAVDLFGVSVSVSGDTLAVGARLHPSPGGFDAGSAYVFVRSGTTWIQQQELTAPDGGTTDNFGYSVSISGDTVVVGSPDHDTAGGMDAGAAYVFRELSADLGVTKTDGQTTALPGQPVTFTITASNAGPGDVTAASVTDTVPAALPGATWTCAASSGSTCGSSGSGTSTTP